MFNKILSIFVLSFTIVFAQDFTGIRIYINPGHGGHDPANDRYIPETGFWESEGNLAKGLYLRDILNSMGATTQMSRTTNNDSDDLGLSEISAAANNFDADYFQSIHSNATGVSTKRNTTLILFRGYTSSPVFPEAKVMANLLATEIYTAHRTTGKSVYGDWTFYPDWGTQGLGVLRNLTMPGTLSEGSFHDYIPESWRLKSEGYLKHEAWAFVKAFIDYFELDELPYGEVAGILRDPFALVDYYYLSGTNDANKPLNLVKATLLPDNKIYEGDSYNNGFYLLDSIAPGIYDIVLEAEDYYPDTVSVTISAGETTFLDKYLTSKPNYSAPEIVEFLPEQTENVELGTEISFEFTIRMNTSSVENAFTISPNVKGTFNWELNDKLLTFTPDEYLSPETDYQITIANTAKSYYNVTIANNEVYSFSTRPSLKLISSYPQQNSVDVSADVKIKLKFNAAVDFYSLSGRISIEDLEGNTIALQVNPDEADYENGWVIFEPQTTFLNNKSYQVKLGSGISDTEGTILSPDTTITFRIEGINSTEGSLVLDFEDDSIWEQPDFSGSTQGIDADATAFTFVSDKKVDGSLSGKLEYVFINEDEGVCRIYCSSEPALTSNSQSFGIWVYGDFSNNKLEYWFRDDSETNIPLEAGVLDYTGWKFISVDVSGYTNLKFHSLVIVQKSEGEKNGWLYFDNALTDAQITGVKESEILPSQFELKQNYPNPFNPATKIIYTLPNISKKYNVTVKIYDVLGRQVEILFNGEQSAGTYNLNFDGSSLSSGIYYYTINAGDFISTKKMILLK